MESLDPEAGPAAGGRGPRRQKAEKRWRVSEGPGRQDRRDWNEPSPRPRDQS